MVNSKKRAEKPRKVIYPVAKQAVIYQRIKRKANMIGRGYPIRKIFLFGSLAQRKFGVYERPFGSRKKKGSDIDLLILPRHNFTPKWKLLGKYESNDLYLIGVIDRTHEIHGIVYNEKEHSKEMAQKYGLPLQGGGKSRNLILLFDESNSFS